jgi:hypothetical protein
MSINKFKPHVYVIPEDRDNEQIADGFVNHQSIDERRIQIMPSAGGWPHVLRTFQNEYIPSLRQYPEGYVVMLIDFDEVYNTRRLEFENAIPDDLKDRVFVLGCHDEPIDFKNAISASFEEIGRKLADDCDADTTATWNHEHLKHNDPDRSRLVKAVRPILFK